MKFFQTIFAVIMAQNTKIIPTIAERLAAQNTNFFDAKRELTGKIIYSLEQLGEHLLQEVIIPVMPANGYNVSGFKVSRGENFNGYPFIVLDCPRINDTQSEVICRTIFWWGHHWSLHFALQGKALKRLNLNAIHQFDETWQLYTGNHLWEQNPSIEESIPLHTFDASTHQPRHFFKVYRKTLLAEAEQWPPYSMTVYKELFNLLT